MTLRTRPLSGSVGSPEVWEQDGRNMACRAPEEAIALIALKHSAETAEANTETANLRTTGKSFLEQLEEIATLLQERGFDAGRLQQALARGRAALAWAVAFTVVNAA